MIVVLRTLAHCFSLSIALALPSNLRRLPLGIREVDSMKLGTSSTTSNPFLADTVSCIGSYITPRLVPFDCSIVLNFMLLSQPGLFNRASLGITRTGPNWAGMLDLNGSMAIARFPSMGQDLLNSCSLSSMLLLQRTRSFRNVSPMSCFPKGASFS